MSVLMPTLDQAVLARRARIVADLRASLGREPGVMACRTLAKERGVELPIELLDSRPYDLRHSYASILISAGVSPAYVQQQLGHASIKITVDVYAHLIPGAGRQALQHLPGTTSPRPSESMVIATGH